jgi:DNA-binding transcriptional MerR regulator
VKLYYRIGEVASIVGVEPHVLRYWESRFRSIRPQKSRSGQRVYSRNDVNRLLKIRDLLYSQGFTVSGARKKLRQSGVEATPIDDPALVAARTIRGTLLALREDVTAAAQRIERLAAEIDQPLGQEIDTSDGDHN